MQSAKPCSWAVGKAGLAILSMVRTVAWLLVPVHAACACCGVRGYAQKGSDAVLGAVAGVGWCFCHTLNLGFFVFLWRGLVLTRAGSRGEACWKGLLCALARGAGVQLAVCMVQAKWGAKSREQHCCETPQQRTRVREVHRRQWWGVARRFRCVRVLALHASRGRVPGRASARCAHGNLLFSCEGFFVVFIQRHSSWIGVICV